MDTQFKRSQEVLLGLDLKVCPLGEDDCRINLPFFVSLHM